METIELNETFWDSQFASSTYQLFATVKETCKDCAADAAVNLELEARLGDTSIRLQNGNFSPGCTQEFFRKVKDHFCRTNPPTSETYDVAFRRSKLRVSVAVSKERQVKVVEVMRKVKDNNTISVDALLRGNKSHDLRISLMVERQVGDEESAKEQQAALRWVQTLINPYTEIDPKERLQNITSGCACRIVPSIGTPVKWESNSSSFSDISNIWLQPNLQWTILDQDTLVGATNNQHPAWWTSSRSDPINNFTNVIVGNLPGMITNKTGTLIPVTAFEYRVFLQVKDLIPVVPVNAIVAYNDDEVFVRHKKQWKYPLPVSHPDRKLRSVLDFTQTRQGETQNDLQSSPPKFEIEMEQSFSIADGKEFNPVEETIGFLKATASILFTTSIPKPSERVVSSWKALPTPKKVSLYHSAS